MKRKSLLESIPAEIEEEKSEDSKAMYRVNEEEMEIDREREKNVFIL